MFNRVLGNTTSVSVGGHTWTARDKKALLYFFSPQELPETSIRPSHYAFDQEFFGEVEEILDTASGEYNGSIGGNLSDPHFISPGVNRSIKPSFNGIAMDNRRFEGLWTFLLIIDNAPLMGRTRSRAMANRLMYIGFVMDGEPCSTLFGKPTLNENAILMPTHKTHLNIQEYSDASGYRKVIIPQLDEDIVSPSMIQAATPERGFILEPHSLISSYMVDGDGMEVNAPGLAYIGNRTENIRFDTDSKNPKRQLNSVLKGLVNMRLANSGDHHHRSGYRLVDSVIRDSNTDREIVRNSLLNKTPDVLAGIRINQPIRMSELIHEYPSVTNNVEVVNLPFNVEADVLNTMAPTPGNIWTALLESSLPPIFSYYGVCDIAFRYCSHNPDGYSRLDNQPIWEVQDIGTYIPMEQENIQIRWQRILEHMETQVFDVIKANCGEFDVVVRYTANNYCAIQLQLMDIDDRPNDGFAITHGVTNPLATPLLGRESDRLQNAGALDDLIAYSGMHGNNIRY